MKNEEVFASRRAVVSIGFTRALLKSTFLIHYELLPNLTGFSSWDAQRRDLHLDRDKTPTLSAVSRLENKYSDILERTAAGRRRHEEDRDKTLEPDDYGGYSSGLLRSATSHQLAGKGKLSSSSFNAADRKERTPYRMRTQRQRYMADSSDSGYLTSGNRLLDENYPVDYGHSRYHQPQDYHEALRAGGATGHSTGRYGRRGGEEDTALTSGRLSRAYGPKNELPASDGINADDWSSRSRIGAERQLRSQSSQPKIVRFWPMIAPRRIMRPF